MNKSGMQHREVHVCHTSVLMTTTNNCQCSYANHVMLLAFSNNLNLYQCGMAACDVQQQLGNASHTNLQLRNCETIQQQEPATV